MENQVRNIVLRKNCGLTFCLRTEWLQVYTYLLFSVLFFVGQYLFAANAGHPFAPEETHDVALHRGFPYDSEDSRKLAQLLSPKGQVGQYLMNIKTILVPGFGDGKEILVLANTFPEAKIEGWEIRTERLNSQLMKRLNGPEENISLWQGNLLHIQPRKKFDLVYFRHPGPVEILWKKIIAYGFELVRPGGFMLLTMYMPAEDLWFFERLPPSNRYKVVVREVNALIRNQYDYAPDTQIILLRKNPGDGEPTI